MFSSGDSDNVCWTAGWGAGADPKVPSACEAQAKAFTDCMSANNGDMGACQFYFDALQQCKLTTWAGCPIWPHWHWIRVCVCVKRCCDAGDIQVNVLGLLNSWYSPCMRLVVPACASMYSICAMKPASNLCFHCLCPRVMISPPAAWCSHPEAKSFDGAARQHPTHLTM